MLRWSVRVHNLPSPQIAGHLNKAPIEIQSCLYLLVLVVTGSTNTDFSSFILTGTEMANREQKSLVAIKFEFTVGAFAPGRGWSQGTVRGHFLELGPLKERVGCPAEVPQGLGVVLSLWVLSRQPLAVGAHSGHLGCTPQSPAPKHGHGPEKEQRSAD